MKTIGSMWIVSAKLTTNGPNSTPNTLKVWIKAAAIDWISTVKAYVCTHANKVYAMSVLGKNHLRRF